MEPRHLPVSALSQAPVARHLKSNCERNLNITQLKNPRHQPSYSQMMSKGSPITETKRIVFRFHKTILSFGEPGSLGKEIHLNRTYIFGFHSNFPGCIPKETMNKKTTNTNLHISIGQSWRFKKEENIHDFVLSINVFSPIGLSNV